MQPEQITALRKELQCTARELASALGVDQPTILAWERGELFPTKRFVNQMEELRQKGPAAIARNKKGAQKSPMKWLADPELWKLFRKIIAHPDLFSAVSKLAAEYDDPAENP